MHELTSVPRDSETLADRVRRLRLSRHMSRIELAYAAGVSKSHVHQIETGQRTRMRLVTLAKYARTLGVPPSYIDYGYGNEHIKSSEPRVELTATLRQAIELEDHQIEQVLRLIQGFQGENARRGVFVDR
jgi:transcriptional regulator with XRE-family HTH domain